ncbi:hypothetical protein TPY_2030 [Sulfobacillus acidophilus TPY]|uniref:DNA polymerase beta domain protein region n=1 Tax=Sulfobacillus acidophilus (strain ATCC 700253 / DSM 10332 / NAL) TaxID=679936 RepID=G8TTM9_SULAD|nr:hypothetical protein TPY_2030 [Sulfobacillus acidophilus TPY]AEW05695.1 DNA polymerase beta domain protein region [Sulfobacillus acidophilus DSM 10332]
MEVHELMSERQEYQEYLWQMARHIAQQLHAWGVSKVILFGSLARGQARKHSDIDLAVVWYTDLPPLERAAALYRRLGPLSVPVDIIVLTPEEADPARLIQFGQSIFKEGIAL